MSLQLEPGEGSLDMGELQQVLRDEELARKLQEEEERRSKRVRGIRVYSEEIKGLR